MNTNTQTETMNTDTATTPVNVLPSYRENSAENIALQHLMNQIEGEVKIDYATPWNRIEVLTPNRTDNGNLGVKFGDHQIPFNRHFQRQMSSSIAPGLQRFGDHLLEKGEFRLFAETHNRLLSQSDKKAQIRTIANGMPQHGRAFLSDSFKAIDDDLVFNAALPVIGEFGDKFQSIGGRRTDARSYAKIVTRQPVFEIQSGDRLRKFHAGFLMSNSEVGSGFAQFQAFFTDDFCKNGCVFSKLDLVDCRFAHRGSRISTDFGQIMGERVRGAELAEVTGLIEDAARTACSSDYGQVIELIEKSNERTVTGDPVKVLEAVGTSAGLTKSEIAQLPVYFNSDESTQLGVNSAITRLAQEAPTFERRTELEAAGGKVLSMDDRAWSAVSALS